MSGHGEWLKVAASWRGGGEGKGKGREREFYFDAQHIM